MSDRDVTFRALERPKRQNFLSLTIEWTRSLYGVVVTGESLVVNTELHCTCIYKFLFLLDNLM